MFAARCQDLGQRICSTSSDLRTGQSHVIGHKLIQRHISGCERSTDRRQEGIFAAGSVSGPFISIHRTSPLLCNQPSQRRQSLTVCASTSSWRSSREDAASPFTLDQSLSGVLQWCYSLYKFSRPHTMFGTFVSVCSISLLALGPGEFTSEALAGGVVALVSALLMNICITGMNQIFDIEIDKVNKPELPLASGEYSVNMAIGIVLTCGAVSLAMGWASGSIPLLITLAGSLCLGIAYSCDLPFLRWKQYPALATACILSVRAVLVQLGFYFHMKWTLGVAALSLTRPLTFAMTFMLFASVVIALFKDIPDVRGDQQAGIKTMSVRVGVKGVFWTCITLMELAYLGAMAVGMTSPVMWSRAVMVGGHAAAGLLLLSKARKVNLQSSKSIYDCYMFFWKLFYMEYLFIPFFR